MKPLQGIIVLEFCQYLAGPYAGLRLADLGARVIKIERPKGGDACRQLATKNMFADGDSLVFHTINRNKESYAANLKDPADLEKVRRLIARADIMTHNFRPGVMEKIGLDWDNVRAINPRIIYGEVTGYGRTGPWRDKPGQDLLAQARSGLTTLSGNADSPPTPFGLAIADMICGTHFAQGLLAAYYRRQKTGVGARVEVSLLESIIDLQFELFTTFFQDGGRLPHRARRGNAHAYLGAPYGVYRTRDGWIALAMGELRRLADLIDCPALKAFDEADAFARRDEIMEVIATHLATRTTAEWLAILEPADFWCAEVFDVQRLLAHEGYKALGMDQVVRRPNGTEVRTTRCPIRIDGERLYADRAAPVLGADNPKIEEDLLHA
ncbi:MAG: CoA transferase [Verrucomicrobia bacterium]|nr:MAG: CoA transferase [Verrucomicrobiota bacterium]